MIKGWIRKIRQKPKHVRDNIALLLALIFTSGVTAVWLYNAPARYSAIGEKYAETEDAEKSPGFANIFSGVGEQFASLKEVFSSMATTTDNSEATGSVQVEASSTDANTMGLDEKKEEQKPPAKEIRVVVVDSATSTPTSTPTSTSEVE